MEEIRIRGKNGEEVVLRRHGSHVTSFTLHGEEVLFVSRKALFRPPKAIRGGVPICFPQFSDLGCLNQSHGFARNVSWNMKDVQEDRAVLSLNHSEVPEWKEQYPYAWEAEIEVWLDEVPSTLSMRARVRNVGDDIMPFTFAFHTYLRAEADSVRVEGLEGLEYWDNTNNRRTQVDDQSHLTPRSEIDRVYFSAPESVRVLDTAYRREILVRKRNLSGVVVWNPWIEKAMALVDMDDLEYKEMICIEPVEVQTIRLPPGQTWEAEQRLEVRKLGLSKAPAL